VAESLVSIVNLEIRYALTSCRCDKRCSGENSGRSGSKFRGRGSGEAKVGLRAELNCCHDDYCLFVLVS
jgi:hypothetical protein